jgi:hypothetical protein
VLLSSLRGVKSVVFERHQLAGAASGKAGGFLAGGWGDGGVTEQLHRVSTNNEYHPS